MFIAGRFCRIRSRAGSAALACAIAVAAIGAAAMLITGCSRSVKPPAPMQRYAILPPKQVPEFLKGTIDSVADWVDTEPKLVSGFGVLAHLKNTGDNTLVPQTVRAYIIKQMVTHGFGSKLQPGYENMQPEDMLRSPTVSIVRVDGYLKPGIRKGDRFDIQVSALPGTNTSSIARGVLYRTDLKLNGAFIQEPGYEVAIPAFGEGSVFVNPTYALEGDTPKTDAAKASLRYGLIMNGGTSLDFRPLLLRLRQPQRSLARAIEFLIEERFASLKQYQSDKFAAAKDEGIVFVQVPEQYHGDWQHFAGVVSHLYLDTRPGAMAKKAEMLAAEAVKPNARLQDISYCWEAIGSPALDSIEPLMTNPSPDVAYAASRAAAYIGSDPAAIESLVRIAMTKDDPFQLNAIQVLGDLPASPQINQQLRRLLDSPQNLVRIAAYRVLADKNDPYIYSRQIMRNDGQDFNFTLDIVPSKAPPIIYASTRGEPRIAIIGSKPTLSLPVLFTALNSQLTISSTEGHDTVTVYYRGMDVEKPVKIESNPDIAEIAARLGGVGPAGDPTLNFNYGDVVAMLQALSDSNQVSSITNGQRVPATFVMEEVPKMQKDIDNAPIIPDQGRPEGTGDANEVGLAK